MTGFIENLRMIKDEQEIATIRRACQISDQSLPRCTGFYQAR